jgi:hypothetical protein
VARAGAQAAAEGEHLMDKIKVDILKEHLPYELDMLDEAAAYARSTEAAETNTKKGQVWFKRNAAIEAFWTHARNLIEFLTREKSPDLTVSSASAQDFTETSIPRWKWRPSWTKSTLRSAI